MTYLYSGFGIIRNENIEIWGNWCDWKFPIITKHLSIFLPYLPYYEFKFRNKLTNEWFCNEGINSQHIMNNNNRNNILQMTDFGKKNYYTIENLTLNNDILSFEIVHYVYAYINCKHFKNFSIKYIIKIPTVTNEIYIEDNENILYVTKDKFCFTDQYVLFVSYDNKLIESINELLINKHKNIKSARY